MLEKVNKVIFSLRMKKDLYEWTKEEAEKMGIPQSTFLLVLINDGRRLRSAKKSIGFITNN